MYQVVAVSESPSRRMKMASFPQKREAVGHAEKLVTGVLFEVVDDRTGLLKTIVTNGVALEVLVPTRRDIL